MATKFLGVGQYIRRGRHHQTVDSELPRIHGLSYCLASGHPTYAREHWHPPSYCRDHAADDISTLLRRECIPLASSSCRDDA